jgi:hypothetical protein
MEEALTLLDIDDEKDIPTAVAITEDRVKQDAELRGWIEAICTKTTLEDKRPLWERIIHGGKFIGIRNTSKHTLHCALIPRAQQIYTKSVGVKGGTTGGKVELDREVVATELGVFVYRVVDPDGYEQLDIESDSLLVVAVETDKGMVELECRKIPIDYRTIHYTVADVKKILARPSSVTCNDFFSIFSSFLSFFIFIFDRGKKVCFTLVRVQVFIKKANKNSVISVMKFYLAPFLLLNFLFCAG